jgi:hypothetical protein
VKRRPRVGSRVIVTSGEYAGRQARTENSTGCLKGWIALSLLGGAHELGVSVPLDRIAPDPEKKVRKLPPQPPQSGDKLWSLTGLVFPLGHFITVKSVYPEQCRMFIESDYGTPHELQPRPGFEKRWARLDGMPLDMTGFYEADERRSAKATETKEK